MEKTNVELKQVPLSKIDLDENVRMEEDVSSLILSIKNQGLLQPVGLLEKEDGRYKLVFGYKRHKAITELGWTTIPGLISKIEFKSEKEMDRYFLITNLTENTYEKPSAFEQGRRYLKLMKDYKMSVSEIHALTGESEGAIGDDIFIAKAHVPEEYLHKIRKTSPGAAPRTGTIPISLAKSLIQKGGNAHLGKQAIKEIWDYAIVHEMPTQKLDLTIDMMLRLGKPFKEALELSEQCTPISIRYILNKKLKDSLEKEYGVSMTVILERIIRGELPPVKGLIMKRDIKRNLPKMTAEEKKAEAEVDKQFG